MIAYFATDLLWATRIKSLAEDLGIEARPVRTLDMLDARLADSPVRGLVVDLASPDIALALIRHLRQRASDPGVAAPAPRCLRIVAFGPHVETAALSEAKAAGADAVYTRGAFAARLADMLRWIESEQ